jgi:p-hydroxybenzoate 3-monooxygenase
MRTQVGIVGAGPAGLMLSHLLQLLGIESIVLECRSRRHIEDRVRAGVLEQGTVDLMLETGVGERLEREGLRHEGVWFSFAGRRHRIDMAELTGGRAITVYAQQEVVKDLVQARLDAGGRIVFEVDDLTVHDLDSPLPKIRYRKDGASDEIVCDFIAGCDGFHGVCRPSVPAGIINVYERVYPFGWLGILAAASPTSEELFYTHSERGFALFSMRSPQITRLYLQCAPDEDLLQWPDDRVWQELCARMRTEDGWAPAVGEVIQKGVTGMRSFVIEPMQF